MKKFIVLPNLFGVSCYNINNCASCYIDKCGKEKIFTQKNVNKNFYRNIIFLRGIFFLVFGAYYFIKNINYPPTKQKDNNNNQVFSPLNISKNHALYFLIAIFSIMFGIILLGLLPIKISMLLSGYNYNMFLKKLIVAVVKIFIIYIMLLVLRFLPNFRQFYKFNACACYFENLFKNDEKNEKKLKNMYYFPLNFLNYMVFGYISSILVLSFVGLSLNKFYYPFINLAISIIVFSIAFELLLFLTKCKYSWIRKLCIVTLWLVIDKPTNAEIKICNIAYNEVLLMQNKKREAINSEELDSNQIEFSFAYSEIKEKFKQANILDLSDLDWLFCECLNVTRSQLKLLKTISKNDYKYIKECANRRIKHEPITKIFGRTEFYGLNFVVTKDVLSPRMETEILVEKVLKIASKNSKILDIGTGSGAIAISIAKNSGANITAVDISESALRVAKLNAKNNNVKINFKLSNLFENLKKKKIFDIIVSNPPYIKSNEIMELEEEVKNYDPHLALDGGETGYDFYEKIIVNAKYYLKNKGFIAFEIGEGQAQYIKKLLKNDFENIKVIRDYNKIERFIIANMI